MNNFPETSPSLIANLKDSGDADAWALFERLYRPAIFRIARAKGMQYADAADLVQQVLVSVAKAIEAYQYESNGPKFRNWLSRITRNAILKALSRKQNDRGIGGTQALEVLSEIPAPDGPTSKLIEHEIRQEIFRRAASQVREEVQPTTWLAFELSVLQQQAVSSVSDKLNLSVGNIYAARSRVMKRLREVVQRLEFDHQE